MNTQYTTESKQSDVTKLKHPIIINKVVYGACTLDATQCNYTKKISDVLTC